MLAAYHGHEKTVKMLIDCGAEIDRRNDRGQTPLGGAAFKGHMEIVRLLAEAGADVSADNGSGKTPLMFAAMFGRVDICDYLIARGADPRAQTLFGISAHHIARLTGAFRSFALFRSS